MSIMPLYERTLKRYQAMSSQKSADAAQIACCYGMSYKFHLIRINAGFQISETAKGQKKKASLKMAVDSFREAARYERLPDFTMDKYWSNLLPMFDRPEDPYETDDEEILRLLNSIKDEEIPESERFVERERQLRVCGACEKQEEFLGDFNFCARCNMVPYCGKACQMSDWKVHKILCGKKNTTKVDAAALRLAADILIKNHAKTVRDLSLEKKVVSEAHMKAALPGLLKLLKKLLNQDAFAHFNSVFTFADAGRDAEFEMELNKYFLQQPGYEPLVQIHADHRFQNHLESRSFASKLRVTDDAIYEKAVIFLKGILESCLPAERSLTKAEEVRLFDDFIAACKRTIIAYPVYNSVEGLDKILSSRQFIRECLEIFAKLIK